MHGKLQLKGHLTTFTGLAIGKNGRQGKNDYLPQILVRHPIDLQPFIPASSLKGMVRRALSQEGPECIARILGASQQGNALFRNAVLHSESLQKLQQSNRTFVEIKVCRRVDRITSQGSFYAIERIPCGLHFNFEIFYTVQKPEDIDDFCILIQALVALENFFLGSHGSRGMGRIKFGKWILQESSMPIMESGIELIWYPIAYYREGKEEKMLIADSEQLTLNNILDRQQIIKGVY